MNSIYVYGFIIYVIFFASFFKFSLASIKKHNVLLFLLSNTKLDYELTYIEFGIRFYRAICIIFSSQKLNRENQWFLYVVGTVKTNPNAGDIATKAFYSFVL